MSRHSTAHHFLEGLIEIGVDYLFCQSSAPTTRR